MALFDFLKKKELEEIISLKEEIASLKMELGKFDTITNVELEIKQKKDEFEKFISEKTLKLDSEITKKNQELENIKTHISNLNNKYQASLETYSKLTSEVSLFEDKLNKIQYGLYEPSYNFEYSIEYLTQKNIIIAEQLRLALNDRTEIYSRTASSLSMSLVKTVYNSDIESFKFKLHTLMVLAFNSSASIIISKTKWNNTNQLSKQISKLYKQISELGKSNLISVTFSNDYESLKQKELFLEYEYQVKKQKEKEEERANRELLREEEKARREYEKALKDAENEEINYKKSIDKIKKRIDIVDEEEHKTLLNQIKELELKLQEATEKKERAISMAQQTKRGHVYIISNIGAFGENVYKIGMTRRLEPIERVYELGNASVPFHFDIHAMIYSEDAPNLESELHKAFGTNKINMLNHRKEFFRIEINEIESKLKELGIETKLKKHSDAIQYRETLTLIESLKQEFMEKDIEENYPENLLD